MEERAEPEPEHGGPGIEPQPLHPHHQATYPRLPSTADPLPRPRRLDRGHQTVPLWFSPRRVPSMHQSSSCRRPGVHYRKTRATSVNLDSLWGVWGWRADKVEVIRVTDRVGVPQGSTLGPGSVQQLDPAPRLAQEAPLRSSSSSGWTDERSAGSSAVVLRSTPGPRDKTRAWRRHTVVV